MVTPHNFPSRIFHLPAPVDWSAKTDSPVFDLGRSVSLFNPPAFFCPFTVITTQGKAVLGSTWIFRFILHQPKSKKEINMFVSVMHPYSD